MRLVIMILALLSVVCAFGQSQPLTARGETALQVAKGHRELEAFAVRLEAETGRRVVRSLVLRPDGWDIRLFVQDGVRVTEWREHAYPRTTLAVRALEIAYRRFPDGYDGYYQGRNAERPGYCVKGEGCA